MNRHTIRLLSAMLALLLSSTVPSYAFAQLQGLTNLGTDFWFSILPDPSPTPAPGQFFITSSGYCTVTVAYYSGGTGNVVLQQQYRLSPNQSRAFTTGVPTAKDELRESPTYRAIHVTSTIPIAISAFSSEGSGGDGLLVLPTHALGKQYYAMSYFDDWDTTTARPRSGEFMIVAPYDSTNVTITTKSDTRLDEIGYTMGHSAGTTWKVTLMKGETYLVQSRGGDRSKDITGSSVTSDKPIGFISGHEGNAIENLDPFHNTRRGLIEMLPPVDEWGTTAFEVPELGRYGCGDYVRIISGANNNAVSVNGGQAIGLNAGEFFDRILMTKPSSYVSTNGKPLLVMSYSYSQGYNNDSTPFNPFMSTVPSTQQFIKWTTFHRAESSPLGGTYSNYATIVGPQDSLSSVLLNGIPLRKLYLSWRDSVSLPPGIGEVTIQLQGSQPTYTLSSNAPIGVVAYGRNTLADYGLPVALGVAKRSEDSVAPMIRTLTSDCRMHTLQVVDTGSGIAMISMITDSLDPRWSKPSYNMTGTIDSFMTGDSVVNVQVSVIDPSSSAYMAIYVVDRSGNARVQEYSYDGGAVTLIGPAAPVGLSVKLGSDTCMTVELVNTGDSAKVITLLGFTNGNASGFSLPTTTQLPAMLKSGDTLRLRLCFAPTVYYTSWDTLMVQLDCGTKEIVLAGTGLTGLLDVADLDFGNVAVGNEKCSPLQLTNSGNAPLTILSMENDTSAGFKVDPSVHFPLTIAQGQSAALMVCYRPRSVFDTLSILRFHLDNVPKYLHAYQDTVRLTANPAIVGVAPSALVTEAAALAITQLTPNPSSGALRVKYELQRSSSNVAIEVYDIRGAIEQTLVASETRAKGSYTEQFDLTHLAAGEHFLRITTPNASAMRKFVIER